MKMNLMKKKNKKGFTLIELIVVIAIIGILAAIAVPRFSNIQTASKQKSDNTTAAQIINVARMIEADVSTITPGSLVSAGSVTEKMPTSGDWIANGTTYMSIPAHPQSAASASWGLTYDSTAKKYTVTGATTSYVEP